MVIGQRSHGNILRGAITFRWFLLATVIVTNLMTTCNCLPALKEKKPSHPDEALLSGAINEMEDALSRLKQYAKRLKSAAESSNQGEEDPLAESFERESRDEDYRQEPELVPGLDRFEKSVDDKERANSEDLGGISLQDLVNFLREQRKGGKAEVGSHRTSGFEVEPPAEVKKEVDSSVRSASSSTAKEASPSNDISLKDLLEFLKERQNQKNKASQGIPTQPPHETGAGKVKTVTKDDSSDVSLNEALEYLATLKKKLGNERNEQSSH